VLCGSGVEIVSGGAEGIDTVAHRRALALGARTVAVVGTGLLSPFPASNRGLFEAIARGGAVVSEFALDAGGQKAHFPQRNRTMAGTSEAVLFTRGTTTSGAMSTVEAAEKLGRRVFAVPGQVGDPLAAGPNALLAAERARAVLDGGEVVRALGLVPSEPASPARPVADLSLTDGGRRVLEALGPAPRHVDEIAGAAGMATGQALAELLTLELAGLCASRPGKYFQRRPA
jgi:DNA processing protein